MPHEFDASHYVPILKAKAGELDALFKSASIQSAFTALIEIPPIPLAFPDGSDDPVPSKSIDAHVSDVAVKIAKALSSEWPIMLDGFYTEEETLSDGREPIEVVFDKLREEDITFVPVVGLDSVAEYTAAVKTAMAKDKQGGCIRVRESDLEGTADVGKQITALLKFLGTTAKKMHLVIDFGTQVPSKSALPHQLNSLPSLTDWASLTIASTSIPIDLSEVPKNTVGEFDRKEWQVWNHLRANSSKVSRMPTFGDYAVNHPSLTEIDPKIMMMSPNIRYTGRTTFIIAKGQAVPRKKNRNAKNANLLPVDQYPKLAKAIMEQDEWAGADFSPGDAFIKDCSQKKCIGNATTWRSVGTSHHLASVVHQIANLP
jgi:hypothetical protein